MGRLSSAMEHQGPRPGSASSSGMEPLGPSPDPKHRPSSAMVHGGWRQQMNREERERERIHQRRERDTRDLDTATTLWRRKSLAASCSELWAGAAAAGCVGARGGGGGTAELPRFDFFFVAKFFCKFFPLQNFFLFEGSLFPIFFQKIFCSPIFYQPGQKAPPRDSSKESYSLLSHMYYLFELARKPCARQ